MKHINTPTLAQAKDEQLTQQKEAAAKLLGDTPAAKIWNEIKNLVLPLFGLPNQLVSNHCVPKLINPNALYVLVSSSAVLPALESILSRSFDLELADKYIVISRKNAI